MSLNIKNEDTHKLVQQLADLTGETLTEAVTVSVSERLKRVKGKKLTSLADRLLAIGKDCAGRLKGPIATVEHGQLLYNEQGLPK